MNHPLPSRARVVAVATLLAGALAPTLAPAQTADGLRDAVQRTLTTNPQVTARLNAFRASVEERNAARGPLLPRVDLTADGAQVRDRLTNRSPETQTLKSAGVALSATQLLWDGLGTWNQLERFDHARLARYFEFVDASDQVALDAVRAHVDVARTRELVRLATDNVQQHRQVAEQIQSRVGAGVGRGVDLEQANARLALAESNLATETSNLHDVTERYVRIVGALPPTTLSVPESIGAGLPASAAGLLEQATRRNAAVAAAVESLRAAQAQSRERDAPFQPRVEAQVRTAAGKNLDTVQSQKRDTSAGVALSWNLFNGGADAARQRQAVSLLAQTADLRDQACRDARQNALVAYNDARKLQEQVTLLQRNVDATTRARDAYRQQFEIGQRSLLDVLNAENELFGSRRALVNAQFDIHVARARAQAASSNLVSALGLSRADAGSATDVANWAAGADAATRCPVALTESQAQAARPLSLTALAATPAPAPSTGTSLQLTPLPTMTPPPAAPTVASVVPAPEAALPAPTAASGSSVSEGLVAWRSAWLSRDVDRLRSLYDPAFKPPVGPADKWFAGRSWLMRKPGSAPLQMSNVQRRTLQDGRVETQFDVTGLPGTTRKVLVWQRDAEGTWRIVSESR